MDQKTILITGCSSGIGYDAALGLRDRGWRVFATCRQQVDVDALIGRGFESVLLDYADEASIENALSIVLRASGGRLDALFNNGAFACPGAVEDLPRDAMRSVFETNFFGYHDLTRKVIPVMRKQGYGRIINCSSVLGMVVLPWRGAYNASKFALEGLTHTLRVEMRDDPIHVILIQPGPITTKIRTNSIPHFEKWIDWEASHCATIYKKIYLKRLYEKKGKDYFERPPSAVTKKLIKSLEAKNPKPCYYVTLPTYFMGILKRLLPMRAMDWVLSRL
ncbi:MAG: short-chain dehydrogenase [Aestuariivita sp.]|nr:short-chain dehydrogenase [Aestuariivita sp.]